MAHHSVIRIKKKSWTAGFGKNKDKGNYHVGQKELEVEITWIPEMKTELIPFVNEHGHQGIRIRSTHQKIK